MEKNNLQKMVDNGLSIAQIARNINKSKTTARYWLKKFELKTKNPSPDFYRKLPKASVCKFCLREYEYGKKKGHQRTICNSCLVTRYKFTVKQKLVNKLGGACNRCGYSKCVGSLQFHHKDGQTKDFTLSTGYHRKMSELFLELEKCELVCANCHGEIHFWKKLS